MAFLKEQDHTVKNVVLGVAWVKSSEKKAG
jgi:hypothetical protein